MIGWPERLIALAAGLAGLLGVATSAAAVHSGAGPTLETSARFLMFHAPALLALAAALSAGVCRPVLGRLAGLLLVVGVALFSGDLACRALQGSALFPMAAPAGGILLMGGWLLAGIAALVAPRR